MSSKKTVDVLYDDYMSGRREAGFAPRHGITTMDAAYDIQGQMMTRVLATTGARRYGYKIGLTSVRMQALCGIETPVAGLVRSDEVVQSPGTLALSAYGHLGLEFEIAVRLSRDLDGPGPITLELVAAAVDGVAPAVEIVDDRKLDLKQMDVLSLIAENTWNAGLQVGTFVAPPVNWGDLADTQGTLAINGASADTGYGRDALGHPYAPVAWLASYLITRGQKLCAGDVISTGSIMPVRFPNPGDTFTFTLAGIGTITTSVTA